MSRIYGGIHYMSANLQGLDAGASIGEWDGSPLPAPEIVTGPGTDHAREMGSRPDAVTTPFLCYRLASK